MKIMQTKQTIAIIGATGNMGSAISKSLAKGNYRLLLKGGKPEALKALKAEILKTTPLADLEAMDCSRNASHYPGGSI
jgi:short-subunit dehydrogenase